MSWVARTRARSVSRSPARSPLARPWISTLPRAVASTGPATTVATRTAIGGGEAVEDAADQSCPGARDRLVEVPTGRRDPGWLVAGRQERRIVRIDDRPAGRELAGGGQQAGQGVR